MCACLASALRSLWHLSSWSRICPILKWEARIQPMHQEGLSRLIVYYLLSSQPFQSAHVPLMLAGSLPDAPTRMHTWSAHYSGAKSPAQMLQFRPYFAKRFEQLVKENTGWRCSSFELIFIQTIIVLDWLTDMSLKSSFSYHTPSGKNLRAAKHRFESLQKPTGRLVLHMAPMMICLEQIARERFGRVACRLHKNYFFACP